MRHAHAAQRPLFSLPPPPPPRLTRPVPSPCMLCLYHLLAAVLRSPLLHNFLALKFCSLHECPSIWTFLPPSGKCEGRHQSVSAVSHRWDERCCCPSCLRIAVVPLMPAAGQRSHDRRVPDVHSVLLSHTSGAAGLSTCFRVHMRKGYFPPGAQLRQHDHRAWETSPFAVHGLLSCVYCTSTGLMEALPGHAMLHA